MKNAVKNIILALSIALCCVGIIFLAIRSGRQVSDKLCKEIEITIDDTLKLIDAAELRNVINESLPAQIGKKYKDVELEKVEKAIRLQCEVESAEAWLTTDGVLHVSVLGRIPVCVFQDGNKLFYSDKEGNLFPVKQEPLSYIPVIEGSAEANVSRLDSLMYVVNHLPDGICRLIVDHNGELEFFRVGGNELFRFGRASETEDKFEKYRIYIENILTSKTDTAYSTVDLRYKGQIICK